MEEIGSSFAVFREFTILDAIDVLLVGYLIYRVLLLVRGTRAWRIILGIATFVVLLVASSALRLNTLHWILDKAALLGPVALVILLLPELRQALEGFGRLGIWPQALVAGTERRAEAQTIEELVAAVAEMAEESTGALIVVEKGAPLDEIVSNGVTLNARVSAALLGAIFHEGNPLHDGAAVIRGDTIVAAACRLPLSDSQGIDSHVHMRHRAGVGVTEALDCFSIIVSEERGTISYAADGRLRKLNSPQELRELLNQQLRGDKKPAPRVRRRREEAQR